MANNSRNSLNTYAAVGAAAAGAMLYKRTHTTCGQCGCKITGRQYTIRAYNEEGKAAIEMAGANPHAKYCSDCYASLKSEFVRIEAASTIMTVCVRFQLTIAEIPTQMIAMVFPIQRIAMITETSRRK